MECRRLGRGAPKNAARTAGTGTVLYSGQPIEQHASSAQFHTGNVAASTAFPLRTSSSGYRARTALHASFRTGHAFSGRGLHAGTATTFLTRIPRLDITCRTAMGQFPDPPIQLDITLTGRSGAMTISSLATQGGRPAPIRLLHPRRHVRRLREQCVRGRQQLGPHRPGSVVPCGREIDSQPVWVVVLDTVLACVAVPYLRPGCTTLYVLLPTVFVVLSIRFSRSERF